MTYGSVTGQRKYSDEKIVALFKEGFVRHSIDHLFVGMCHGVDLLAGMAALEEGVSYTACLPWRGHKPPRGFEELYWDLRKRAEDTWCANDSFEFPGAWVYHERNRFMVDNAEVVLAYWDGTPSGGTYQTLRYAKKVGVGVENLHDSAVSI